jgi:hypothetical protein
MQVLDSDYESDYMETETEEEGEAFFQLGNNFTTISSSNSRSGKSSRSGKDSRSGKASRSGEREMWKKVLKKKGMSSFRKKLKKYRAFG